MPNKNIVLRTLHISSQNDEESISIRRNAAAIRAKEILYLHPILNKTSRFRVSSLYLYGRGGMRPDKQTLFSFCFPTPPLLYNRLPHSFPIATGSLRFRLSSPASARVSGCGPHTYCWMSQWRD
ncbi:hypothetical protein AVEN_16589-1 [Araneus ventricosus]|uniref:Uncharacterized protein n=1 Tax=Araneus ventricosus TaxID=182803 RepID=A0A4Y2JNW4_ARAVE|nr:hypothetical protein AVEN_16589-1 [Araneus ventricosus]